MDVSRSKKAVVLTTGQTALIEANDGYSIGAYSPITSAEYAPLILTRWSELMQTLPPAPDTEPL